MTIPRRTRSTSQGKTAVERLVLAYTRHFPMNRGKSVVQRIASRVLLNEAGLVQTNIGSEATVELRLADIVQAHIYWYGAYEKPVLALWRGCLRSGMVVVDCGAHIGQYTVVAAKHVGTTGEVHAFEPNLRTYAQLERNVALNNFRNVVLNTQALGEKVATASPFYMYPSDNPGSSSLRPLFDFMMITEQPVAVTTLDEYFAKRGRLPDLVKLDVEGGEISVLQGSTATIAKARPILFIEANEFTANAFDCSTSDLVAHLLQRDYEVFAIGKDCLLHLSAPKKLMYENLAAFPSEKWHDVQSSLRPRIRSYDTPRSARTSLPHLTT